MTNFIRFHDCHPDEFVRVVDHHLLHSGPLRCCFCYAESHSHGVQPAYGVFGNCEGGPWRLGEFVNVPEEDVFFWPRTCATKQDGSNFWWLLYGRLWQIPRSSEDTSGSDTLTSAKVSHSTQLVLLGCLGCKRCWNRYQKLKGTDSG